jgi:acyl-CoA synthetase (AMP-forming)/AMP-acid ligase II
MSEIDFLVERLAANPDGAAVVWGDETYSYGWLLEHIGHWQERLRGEGIRPGTIVALEADFSPTSVALFLALIARGCTLVPLAPAVGARRAEFLSLAQVEVSLRVDGRDDVEVLRYGTRADHPLYQRLREAGRPGLVLFSSGSTGASKAAVHDFVPLLAKFRVRRHSLRTVSFLLFDHIGGVNTALYTLSNGGCLIVLPERSPDAVLAAVARHQVELLPTSPTFLNLVLLSGAHQRHDLSSLKTVTYGTEPMPESTLQRFNELFPHIRLQQTYGLSEVGILRSQSRSSDSLWVKVGGEGYATRVIDGILHVKAESAMLGYLNAPSPFTSDGWLVTGDAVECDGEYIRILGRASEIINVGGEKVYPAEVESVLQARDDIAEVTVYGERNPITGNIVCARVTPMTELSGDQVAPFISELKRYCRAHLRSYQVPVRIQISTEAQHNARFKRVRQASGIETERSDKVTTGGVDAAAT